MFQKEIGEIYRLKIPFENLYTSVFLIRNEKGNILIDAATKDGDVDEWIVPSLAQMGLTVLDIKYLYLEQLYFYVELMSFTCEFMCDFICENQFCTF
jgi:hypothetical protein